MPLPSTSRFDLMPFEIRADIGRRATRRPCEGSNLQPADVVSGNHHGQTAARRVFCRPSMRPLPRICCVSPFAGLAALTIALAASTANAASAWATFGGNAQHTGLSASPSQPLSRVRWSTPVDLSSPGEPVLVHYGSPLITTANTVIIPVKTSAEGAFRLDARKGRDGSLVWSATTDYVAPPHGFFPSYSPALTSAGRVWFPGAGGTMVFQIGRAHV